MLLTVTMSDSKSTFELFMTIFTFGSAVAAGAFWLASWRSQMLLKELQLKVREEQMIFREEVQRTLDIANESFRLDVQKSLDNYRLKLGVLKHRNTEMELFLTKTSGFHPRRELPPDAYPTDFTSAD